MSDTTGRPPLADLLDDQRRRWQGGAAPPVEEYVARHPALAGDSGAVLDLIFQEVTLRERRGERPRLEEYAARFPHLAETLRLQFLIDQAMWAETPPAGEPAGDEATTKIDPAAAPAPAAAEPHLDGYEILGLLGRGGMGAVWLGRDRRLGRDVAVKVMKDALSDQPHLRRRFREEAQVASQLQHPAIPPVHELGELPDGRPYFAMKVVRGRTLAELLAARPQPADGRPHFLEIFEQVCQAVAYAHSKGVIHRDLKPANVMVGAFGEVQVMDWGLAKVLTDEAQGGAAGSVVEVVRPAGAEHQTQAGSVLGTYAYMAPEQARGEVDRLDRRCDVFGLGAILCEILTGRPPYAGTFEEVRDRAALGEVGPARQRLAACGADGELIDLAGRCLNPAAEGRPAGAAEVTAALTAYRAGVQERLRRAELERAAAEARAVEERKRRRAQLALVAALLVLVSGGAGGWWWWQQRRQAVDATVGGQLAQALLLLDQATRQPLAEAAKYREALDTARKARELADGGGASAAVRRRAGDLVGQLEDEVEAARRDRRLLAALLEVRGPREGPQYRKDEQGVLVLLAEPSADEQFAAAFREWDPAFAVDALTTEEAAARLRPRPAAVLTEVVAALDEWAAERRRQGRLGAEWQRLADLADALSDSRPGQGALRDLLARDNLARERALGALAMALRPVPVPFDAGAGDDRSALRRLAAQTDAAREPVLGLLSLVRGLRLAGDDATADRLLWRALQARPQEVALLAARGSLLEEQPSHRAEAVACYAAARALRPELGESLAHALVIGGRAEQGLALYERLEAERPEYPWLYFRHGQALDSLGRFQEAAAAYGEAARLEPGDPPAHNNLAGALFARGRYAEAEAEYRQAVRLNPELAEPHSNLAAALINQGRNEEAEAQCREAIRLKHDLAEAHNNLSYALINQGRHKEAEAPSREAIRLKPDLAGAYINLGASLGSQGRYREAEAASRQAIRLQPGDSEAHNNLGRALADQGRLPEAAAAFREAVRLDAGNAVALCNLGSTLRRQGRFAEALVALRRGDELGRQTPGWPFPSPDWVRRCERLAELDRKLPAVLRGVAEPAGANERLELARLCQQYKGFHVAAARLSAEAFAENPKLADDFKQGSRYDAACSAALAAAGRAEDAKHLPDKVALMLRRQALAWLRSELALYATAAGRDPAARLGVRQRLAQWRQDPDLASVRDDRALDALPEDERPSWRGLWQDAAGLLKRVEEMK